MKLTREEVEGVRAWALGSMVTERAAAVCNDWLALSDEVERLGSAITRFLAEATEGPLALADEDALVPALRELRAALLPSTDEEGS